MKKFILFLLILNSSILYSHWDLHITSNVLVDFVFESYSIPFEGLNRYGTQAGTNRIEIIQNGSFHRRFDSSGNFLNRNIVRYSYSDTSINNFYASTYAELVQSDMYGFAKYLLEFKNGSKSISFFFNTLDSKAGTDSLINGIVYHDDIKINYIDNGASAIVVIGCLYYGFTDTIYQNQQYKEVKLWKLFFNRETPIEKKFFARSTPFPVNDNVATYVKRKFYNRNKSSIRYSF